MKLSVKILISVIMSFAHFALLVLENLDNMVPSSVGVEDENVLKWNGSYHGWNGTDFENGTLPSDKHWPSKKFVVLVRAVDIKSRLHSRYLRMSVFGRQRNENLWNRIFGNYPTLTAFRARCVAGINLQTDPEQSNNATILRFLRCRQQAIYNVTHLYATCFLALPTGVEYDMFPNGCFVPSELKIDYRKGIVSDGMDKYWESSDGGILVEAEDIFPGGDGPADVFLDFFDAILFESSLIAGIAIHVYLKIVYFVVAGGGKFMVMLFKTA